MAPDAVLSRVSKDERIGYQDMLGRSCAEDGASAVRHGVGRTNAGEGPTAWRSGARVLAGERVVLAQGRRD